MPANRPPERGRVGDHRGRARRGVPDVPRTRSRPRAECPRDRRGAGDPRADRRGRRRRRLRVCRRQPEAGAGRSRDAAPGDRRGPVRRKGGRRLLVRRPGRAERGPPARAQPALPVPRHQHPRSPGAHRTARRLRPGAPEADDHTRPERPGLRPAGLRDHRQQGEVPGDQPGPGGDPGGGRLTTGTGIAFSPRCDPPGVLMTGPQATLLIVDDEELNRDALGRRLERHHYDVAAAESGRRAIELLGARRFDLVLLDIMMPGMNGLEVLKFLRRVDSLIDLPIIMVTAKGSTEDMVEALELGANDYVTKPLDFPVVLARIRTQLALRRAVGKVKELEEKLDAHNQDLRATAADLAAANDRHTQDLEAAARVQRALLPTLPPEVHGARFAWAFQPCRQLA